MSSVSWLLGSLLIFGSGSASSNKFQHPLVVSDEYHDRSNPDSHFSPLHGSISSPCGSFRDDTGIWHLYYQYVPDASNNCITNDTSWGHATSADLYNWIDHGVVIAPNENGSILGGSAVVDVNNTSKLFSDQRNGIVAFYTQVISGFQHLKSKISKDGGDSFDTAPLNMTFSATQPQFRDPHVSWNAATETWTMMTAGIDDPGGLLFSSKNLLDWTSLPQPNLPKPFLGDGEGFLTALSLATLPIDNSNKTADILLWSYVDSLLVNIVYHLVGHFDGQTFSPFEPDQPPLSFTLDPDAPYMHFFTNTPEASLTISISSLEFPTSPLKNVRSRLTLPHAHTLLPSGKPGAASSTYMLTTRPYNLNSIIRHGAVMNCPGPWVNCGREQGNHPYYIRAGFTFKDPNSSSNIGDSSEIKKDTLPPIRTTTLDTAALPSKDYKQATLTLTPSPSIISASKIEISLSFGPTPSHPVDFRLAWTDGTITPPQVRKSVGIIGIPGMPGGEGNGTKKWDMEVAVDENVVEVFLNRGEYVETMTFVAEERLSWADWRTDWEVEGLETEFELWLFEGGGVREGGE